MIKTKVLNISIIMKIIMAFQKVIKVGTSNAVVVPPFIVQQLEGKLMYIDWMEIYEKHKEITITTGSDRVTGDGVQENE